MAEHFNVSLGGIQEAEQQLDRGGLSGAVWTQQAKDLAAPHFKIHAVHRARLRTAPEILEHLGQTPHGDDDFAVRWMGSPGRGGGLRIFKGSRRKSRGHAHVGTAASWAAVSRLRPWP